MGGRSRRGPRGHTRDGNIARVQSHFRATVAVEREREGDALSGIRCEQIIADLKSLTLSGVNIDREGGEVEELDRDLPALAAEWKLGR